MSDDPTAEVRARFAEAERIGGDAADPPPPEDPSALARAVSALERAVRFGGEDALLSIVQMPKGIPVASVAIDNATNAGILAASV